jgi:hypothetical protein
METTEKTPWRKNLDKRYISGEDLLLGETMNKGLRKEMVVCIERQVDAPAFDQKDQKEVDKTALWLKDLQTGRPIYKPCLLNVGRAEFLTKESGGSIYMEDWYGLPFIMYAKADKRHGHIVAFKKYYPPATVKPDSALSKLRACTTKEELLTAWTSLTAEEKNLPPVLAEKEKLKVELPSKPKE